MAKRSKPSETSIQAKIGRNKREEWTSSTGVKVILKSIPPLLITSLNDKFVVPKPPQYSITTVAGDVEVYDHDETTLQTPEEKKAWAEYQQKLSDIETEITSLTIKICLVEGMEVVDKDNRWQDWIERMELIGIDLPTSDRAKDLLFKETDVAREDTDIAHILDRVMALTGVDEATLATARASFQDQVESNEGSKDGDTTTRTED